MSLPIEVRVPSGQEHVGEYVKALRDIAILNRALDSLPASTNQSQTVSDALHEASTGIENTINRLIDFSRESNFVFGIKMYYSI